jgi:hypothetical protein
VIKRLGLPDSALAAQSLIDPMRRSSFDRIHDLRQRADFHSFVVDERCKDQMNMVGHHNRDTKVEFLSVIMQARFEDKRPNARRKDPATVGAEGHEMLFVIDLEMRKLPAVESLGHRVYVGTAAFGCPGAKLRDPLMLMRDRLGFTKI